jgi:DNA polymerase-3 subunit delta'
MGSAFSEIFGQEQAVDWLRQAYAADRLPHGLIFAGRAGVGKATTARALSKLFLCEQPKEDQPCGRCESCKIFDSGNHPDYHVISKELIRYHDKTGKYKGIDLSIHVIRPELLEPASRKPVMGRGKVFVIEQADLMNPQAQNALLKTLEEPAGRAIIILLTDQPGCLLPTIRSRCQMVRFAALDEKRVAKELQKRGHDAETAGNAAGLARGSLGLAMRWIDDGVITFAQELIQQLDHLTAGSRVDDLPSWFRRAADAYAQKQLERDELASKDQATREGMTLYLTLAGDHIRRSMSQTDDVEKLEMSCAMIDALAEAETYLDANVNIPLVFQHLAAEMEQKTAAGRGG